MAGKPTACGAVTDALAWQFSGAASSGVQPFVLTVPKGVVGATATNVRIVANTTATTVTSYNIERCTADCTSTTPTFTAIYNTVRGLGAHTGTATGGAPTSPSLSPVDQLCVNLPAVGTGLAHVTVTLSYQHDSLANL